MATSAEVRRLVLQQRAKEAVVTTALVALGSGFEMLSRHSPEMRGELKDWREGTVIVLGVIAGPSIAIRKDPGGLTYLGRGDRDADLKILFKNVDSAFLTFTGQIGADTAFAEHRAIVHGSINDAIKANRAMAIVVKFLFPGVMLKKITKRPPKLGPAELVLKGRLYASLAPMLLKNGWK